MTEAQVLRDEVKQAYSTIALNPQNEPPFPTGRKLAEALGYPTNLLDTLPDTAVAAFCGVSNVSLFAEIVEGASVLDLGCGAGLDMLIASRRTGELGKVIGIDFSPAMLTCARQAIEEAQATNIEARAADAEQLPVEDASIDIAIVNGIFNLNPYRSRIFAELARVVKRGGSVYAAELVLSAPLSDAEKHSTDWFS